MSILKEAMDGAYLRAVADAPVPRRSPELVLDSELLQAGSPEEFRDLLGAIKEQAGLSCGQIAVKASIPRSQAYNMVSKTRTVLPSKPEQVQAFIAACGLTEYQIHGVLDIWQRLTHEQRTAAENTKAATSAGEQERSQENPVESVQNFVIHQHADSREFIRFISYIISNSYRTRRAVTLLATAGCLVLGVLGLLVWWATASTATYPSIAIILFILGITVIPRHTVRQRRR